MKTIIAGSRTLRNMLEVELACMNSGFFITEILSGCASGADELGEQWAKARKIPVRHFPADWRTHGRAAGPVRNREMAAHAEALVAVWDGKSRGTKNMIEEAKKRGLQVHVHMIQ